jgi:predicted GNAT family acetyltransferase
MNSPVPAEIPVHHNVAASRFEAEFGGQLAVADYVSEDGRMIFTHTFVPPELRGRGIAEKLVRAGLALAQSEGRRVVPQCSYVEAFIRRHPEYQGLL